jgi:hypothetical protein
VPLGELGIGAGHIYLAQVHAGLLTLVYPADHGKQPFPPVRKPQHLHRVQPGPLVQPGVPRTLDEVSQQADIGAYV